MPSDPPRYSVSMNPLLTARFLALNRHSKAAGIRIVFLQSVDPVLGHPLEGIV